MKNIAQDRRKIVLSPVAHCIGVDEFSLVERRAIILLWHNAHMQGIEEGREYTIAVAKLLGSNHRGKALLEQTIMALLRADIAVPLDTGGQRIVRLLEGTNIDDPARASCTVSYSLDKRFVLALQDSTIWSKVSIPVLLALRSKYAVSLYENIAQVSGIKYWSSLELTLEEARELLGVEKGKYPAFGNLNQAVLRPSVDEINELASFRLTITPQRTGRKVTHLLIAWERRRRVR